MARGFFSTFSMIFANLTFETCMVSDWSIPSIRYNDWLTNTQITDESCQCYFRYSRCVISLVLSLSIIFIFLENALNFSVKMPTPV